MKSTRRIGVLTIVLMKYAHFLPMMPLSVTVNATAVNKIVTTEGDIRELEE